MADIIDILSSALKISPRAIFNRALPEAQREPMWRAYSNTKEIPRHVLEYCKTLKICSRCGATLGNQMRSVDRRDGVNLFECVPKCPPEKHPVPESKQEVHAPVQKPSVPKPAPSRPIRVELKRGPIIKTIKIEPPSLAEIRKIYEDELD